MRNILRKIVEILDGTPAVYGNKNRWRGQSVVELSLVTPILIILLMGLAEIGWFANNFIILLEVTRVGARFGTSLTDETPLNWNNDASRSTKTGWGDFPPTIGTTNIDDYHNCTVVRQNNISGLRGFYNHIACLMTQQMDPLIYNPNNGVDDIVISAFSLEALDPTTLPTTSFRVDPGGGSTGVQPSNMFTNANPAFNTLDTAYANSMQMVVVGRYPTNANECTVASDGTPKVWERDPFDYFQDSKWNYQYQDLTAIPIDPPDGSNRNYVELEGYDDPSYTPYIGAPAAKRERQRGWVLSGNHGITNVSNSANGTKQCIGSDWTIKDMEKLMNVPDFSLLSGQRGNLPNQGVVLVEMFWKHELLLKNPVFNPVWTILGNNTTISVWAAFPLSTTEPRISFIKDTP
ncbi:MAG: TadE family protein [Chloroflexota bacterium]